VSHVELVWANLRRRPLHALLGLVCATLVFTLYGLGFGITEGLRRAPSVAPAAFGQQLQAIALVVSAAGMALILILTASATAQSVRLRMPEFGILKALGFSHRRIVALVIAEASAPCVAGAVLGLAAAPALFAALTIWLPPLAQLPLPVYSVDKLAAAVAAAVLFPILGSVIPVWRLARMEAFAAMTSRIDALHPALAIDERDRRISIATLAEHAPGTSPFGSGTDMSLWRQVSVVSRTGLSTVHSRFKGALLIVVGVAFLAFVLLYFLSMAEGIRTAILNSGDPSRVLFRSQSTSWLQDGRLPDGVLTIAAEAPGVARGADGSVLAEAVFHGVIGLDPRDGSRRRAVMLVGVGPNWREMTPSFQLVSGRLPHSGSKELLAGYKAREAFSDLDDDVVTYRGEQWQIVGTFSMSDWWNGYLIGDYAEVRSHAGSSVDTAIVVKLQSPGAFDRFRDSVVSRLPPSVKVEREPDFYAGFWKSLPKSVLYVAYLLSCIIAIGVVTGITQVVHAALEERRREIAILRIVGFDSRAVAASVVLESLLLALLGSFAGSALVWLSVDGTYHYGAWSVFQSTVNGHLLLVAMAWASAIAIIGTIPMALTTMRKSEREALADLRLSEGTPLPRANLYPSQPRPAQGRGKSMTTSTGVAAAAGRPLRSSLLAAIAGITLLLPTAHGASAPGKTPDIFGVWLAISSNSANHDPQWANKPYAPAPEFTAWGAEQSREQGRLGVELPTPGACEPISPASFVGGFFPTQILLGHNQIVLLNEWVAVPRRIYMDGRGHPPAEDMLPSWEGHSIGHWEKDTLVVDTIGVNGRTRPLNGYFAGGVNATPESLKAPRLPTSDQMHLVERFRLVGDGKVLEVTKTVTDPKAYVRPFTNVVYMERRPDVDVQEYYCADNERTKDEGH
jgi:putative ABC transport system permease protein